MIRETVKTRLFEATMFTPLVILGFGVPVSATAQTGAVSSNAGQTGAQSSTTDDAPADIVVTAQKRSERLQDVPMTINSATAQQLRSSGITSTDQLGKLVPGFVFQKSTYGLPIYFIRGVGFFDTTLGVSPGVTVYTDQIPLPYSPMSRGAVLDLERVEVLKGPQGTLFGQNSTGGAVNYIAAKPTNELQGGLDISIGRFGSVDTEGFLSGPITDTLSARVALRQEHQGDWQKGYTNADTIGAKRFVNGRLLVDWKPADTAKFEISASGWRDRSDTQQPQLVEYSPQQGGTDGVPSPYPIGAFPAAPDDDRAAAWDSGRGFRRNDGFFQLALRGDIKLGDALSLTSLTSYARLKTSVPLDDDATIYPNDVTNLTGSIKTFAQEIRLNASIGKDIKAIIGANYQRDNVDERLIFDPAHSSGNHVGPLIFDRFLLDNYQDVETKSVFGSVDIKLSTTLSAQAAVRYTMQNRDFTGCTRDSGDGNVANAFSLLSSIVTGTPQTIAPGACVTLDATGRPLPITTGSLDENNVAWRFSLNWKPVSTALMYANVTKGYKSGSFPTLPAIFADQLISVPQESVLAYEAGVKLDLLSHLAQLNAAAFYYDYRKKQLVGYRIVEPFGNLPGLVSIPKSRVLGGEASLTLRPLTGLQLTVNGTYVNSRVQRDPAVAIGPFATPGSFVGQSFPFTPRWQGVADAQYRFPLSSRLSGFVGGDVSVRSATKSVLFSNVPSVVAQESLLRINGYTLVDLRAGVESVDSAWRLELWGRNVGNKFYVVSSSRNSDYLTRFAGFPVTYGMTLSYRFGK